jgi:hypothetical protein
VAILVILTVSDHYYPQLLIWQGMLAVLITRQGACPDTLPKELIPEHSFGCCFYCDLWDSRPSNRIPDVFDTTGLHV